MKKYKTPVERLINKSNYKIDLLIVCLFFFNFCYCQQSHYDRWYEDILKMKTEKLAPDKKDTVIRRILILNPIAEYRYYNRSRVVRCIGDSSFASKLARIDSNYVLFPNKAKYTKLLVGLKMFKILSEYSDSIQVSLNDSLTKRIKQELNLLVQKAIKKGVNKNSIDGNFYNLFKKMGYDQLVLSGILVYQLPHWRPGFYSSFTFCVLDIRRNEIVYFKNEFHSYELFSKHLDQDINQDPDLKKALTGFNGISFPKTIAKDYAKYLVKPIKKKRNKYKSDN